MKQCSTCKKILPATSEFFSKHKSHKDGLQLRCKACVSAHYQAHKEEIAQKQKAYRESHQEECRARSKRYVETHREQYLEYHKQYYQENRDQMLSNMKHHYEVHGERIRDRVKRYQSSHKELISMRGKVRRQSYKEQISQQRKMRYHSDLEHFRAQKRHDYKRHTARRIEGMKQYRQTERGRLARRASWHKREALKKAIGGHYTSQQIQQQYTRQKGKCYYCHNGLSVYHIEHVIPLSRGGSNDIHNLVLSCPTCNLRKGTRLPHEWPEGGRLL